MVGSIVARMDNTERATAAGMCGSKATASACISSTPGPTTPSKWSPKTPLKANEWHHVAITYDGSRKAAGMQDLHQRHLAGNGCPGR